MTDLMARCEALGLSDGPIIKWIERIESLEASIQIKDAKFDQLCKDFDAHDAELKRIIAGLRAELAQAKSAERERCAKVCEELSTFNYDNPGESFAMAIRAFGDGPEPELGSLPYSEALKNIKALCGMGDE